MVTLGRRNQATTCGTHDRAPASPSQNAVQAVCSGVIAGRRSMPVGYGNYTALSSSGAVDSDYLPINTQFCLVNLARARLSLSDSLVKLPPIVKTLVSALSVASA